MLPVDWWDDAEVSLSDGAEGSTNTAVRAPCDSKRRGSYNRRKSQAKFLAIDLIINSSSVNALVVKCCDADLRSCAFSRCISNHPEAFTSACVFTGLNF